VCGQYLAVVSEAMLRLGWNKVEPSKRSEGGCLLRTEHMLGELKAAPLSSSLTSCSRNLPMSYHSIKADACVYSFRFVFF
jgi:hypothetical protein